ncbi:hypothetical protein GIY23_06460 [Allosaccharopolyspora coralli]|uniref:SAM-dependent methyltransferase n=1 Tax=Allosaccharopolyspora coralli TaxID=2665642 RepID=A0A5Q3Q449_9PSEU|nr:SAM-dependent methyltransferase [Allosaccharopolyspora coralli]QGK69222.1 hypothetical protein GIY23_06460 [Allosaccharopolyspora coralli]
MQGRDRHEHTAFSPGAITNVDVTAANAARMYDYYLGGAANFAIDRDAADQVLALTPEVGKAARANRSFLSRAGTYLCEQGIDQFLDLGSGIPTVGNVHEIAHRQNPQARVAYVDHEPVAVAHAHSLLEGNVRTSITHADLRDVNGVLTAPGVADLLDFTRPVGLLAVGVLHFVADADDPIGILASYRAACHPGSYLVCSHGASVTLTGVEATTGTRLYRNTTTPITLRSHDEVTALLDGWPLVDPGLVATNHWPHCTGEEPPVNSYSAVGHLL